ncbi:MAG: CHAD domain-containing protein [Pleurocapsa sp. MO_226.B13]|nr:CHAD domain-containing protein [Pleurocapsa sp. MO_226.B13]
MTYRLQAHESLPQAINRIATEQIEKAIGELAATEELGVDEAVHQARKRLKKTRAVIRLVRDRLGKETYKQANARFRDLGRTLAELRDSLVRIKDKGEVTLTAYSTFGNEIQRSGKQDRRACKSEFSP